MKCKVDGCCKDAMYKNIGLCQMHYFRMKRNGTYEIVKKPRRQFIQNKAGYKRIYAPDSKLSDSTGYVYEHRHVVYLRYGDLLPDCEICGSKIDWSSCHIDHIDECVTNNSIENLRPVCRGCNTSRTERRTIKKYQIGDRSMSLTEWAKHPGVSVTRHQIVLRIKSGWSIQDAVFADNKTHKKKLVAMLKELKEKECEGAN